MKDVTRETCPYCYSNAELYLRPMKRYYFHCQSCDLIFKNTEDRNNLTRYYEKDYFTVYAHAELSGSRDEIYSHTLDYIENKIRVGKLLDVGCGCGFFLKEAKNRGWDIIGIDPSEKSIDYSNNLLGVGITSKGTLKDLSQKNAYDVITMINVLDHSTDPWADIEKAKLLLKPSGLIFLRFPNGIIHSSIFKISKFLKVENLVIKYLVFHEYSFTPKFIKRLLNDHGFTNIEIRKASFSRGNIFNRILKMSVGILVNSLSLISAENIILSPSLEVIAKKR